MKESDKLMTYDKSLDEQAKRLEKAIQSAMMQSPDIKAILCDLESQGISPDVWLVMGISLAQKKPELLTSEDLDFIKSIQVRWDSATP